MKKSLFGSFYNFLNSYIRVAFIALLILFLGYTSYGSSNNYITGAPGIKTPNNIQQNTIRNLVSNNTEYYSNWSGYAVTSTQPFTKVSTKFVQPSVTCPAPGAWTLFWVGFDGFNNGTVEQAGTAATCSYGADPTPSYYAWWEMYPTNNIQVAPLNVSPGDLINPSVIFDKNTNTYQLKVNNQTTKKHFIENETCAINLICSRQSAEWVIERPTVSSGYSVLANWETLNFTDSKTSISTSYKPISSFINTPIDMYNGTTGNILANVSTLNKQGNSFTDNWINGQ